MSRLGLLRTSIRSTLAARTSRAQNHGLLPSLLREPERRFSTEAEQPPQYSAPDQRLSHDAAVDRFVQNPSTGVVYGKLFGTTRHTLKSDIVNFLEGCNLTLEDVKGHYNGPYTPAGMMVQFHSRGDYENAVRVLNRNKVFRLERSDRQRWDIVADNDGKTVLIEGIPRTALQEDVERFLSGTAYESSSIKIFMRLGKKLSQSFLHTHSGHFKPLPSGKLAQILQKSRKQANALRVLDLITPKPTVPASRRQGHLRVIQDFLHSDSDQFSNSSAFSDSHSSIQFSNLFDDLFDSSSVDSQSCAENFTIDASVLSHAISSCGFKRDLHGGVQYHCAAIRSGFAANVYIGSSLISLYSKCCELDNAYNVFEEMPVRNVVSWTVIISGFSQEWQVDVC